MSKKNIARLLLDIKAVTLSPKEPFTYASGRKGPIYCDNRLILSYPDKRKVITKEFIKTIKDLGLEFDIIAGVATGAIATAALLADKLGKPMIYIRASAKDHGKTNQIEGKLEKCQKVLVIEDLINTAGSSVAACESVIDAGADVIACLAIFTYGFPDAHQKFSEKNISVYTLTDFTTLLKLVDDKEDKKILKKWQKDPVNWEG